MRSFVLAKFFFFFSFVGREREKRLVDCLFDRMSRLGGLFARGGGGERWKRVIKKGSIVVMLVKKALMASDLSE